MVRIQFGSVQFSKTQVRVGFGFGLVESGLGQLQMKLDGVNLIRYGSGLVRIGLANGFGSILDWVKIELGYLTDVYFVCS